MTLQRSERMRLNGVFFLLHGLLMLPLMALFAGQDGYCRSALHLIWVMLTIVGYPLVYVLPGLLISSCCLCSRRNWLAYVGIGISWLYATVLQLLLIGDYVLLERFGYHINGLVINLLVTPGGFDAMGLDSATLVPTGCMIFLFICGNLACLWCVWGCKPVRHWLLTRNFLRLKVLGVGAVVLLFLAFCSMFITAIADIGREKDVMIGMNNYPVCLKMRMRRMFKRIGIKRLPREDQAFGKSVDGVGVLNYPDNPIRRKADRKPMNVVWIVCESLRHDMLTPERMPNLWAFAAKNQHFLRHYSGGHGTRPAMFSMFYGLYGNNWNSFLYNHRGPVVIDWMLEDQYAVLCQTSARFTYPEFEQTIFAAVKSQDLVEQNLKLVPWQRDITLTDRMEAFIRKQADAGRPFFAFGFYEETHAPYTFDESKALTKDYMGRINYATVSKKDAPKLYNRMVNAAHGIDRQFGRILKLIQEDTRLKDNTLVVFTGDHGEEFFEKGRLGHNSTFVEEQIRVPLVMGIPGMPPKQHDMVTNHVDIVATLAPYFGVENPPEDFTVGRNMLAPDFKREHAIICGWEIETLVTQNFKYIIPQGNGTTYIGRNFFTGNDVRTELPEDFMSQNSQLLFKVQSEMTRFVRQPE